jgi:putative CocE/NonD family hydrolase
VARAFAERGYQVLLQSTRGTHDCGGEFEPGVAEARDGYDTVRWLRERRWFPGSFVTWGPSYLGYVQWALSQSEIPEWKAAAIGVAPSDWKKWLELEDWPPPEAQYVSYLAEHGKLDLRTNDAMGTTRYRYDPSDPTPNVGGAVPDLPFRYGPKDNRRLEARPDVVTFTSDPAPRDRQVVGPVAAELYVRSSLEHTDFYAKLCDVTPKGRSINLCDGIVRLSPGSLVRDGSGVRRAWIEMAGTAHCFHAGHRIRLQVSSGAHPRFTRNLGTGEPLATATELRSADQEVLHGGRYPSRLVVPFLR